MVIFCLPVSRNSALSVSFHFAGAFLWGKVECIAQVRNSCTLIPSSPYLQKVPLERFLLSHLALACFPLFPRRGILFVASYYFLIPGLNSNNLVLISSQSFDLWPYLVFLCLPLLVVKSFETFKELMS